MITSTFSGRWHGSQLTNLETLFLKKWCHLAKVTGLLCGDTGILNETLRILKANCNMPAFSIVWDLDQQLQWHHLQVSYKSKLLGGTFNRLNQIFWGWGTVLCLNKPLSYSNVPRELQKQLYNKINHTVLHSVRNFPFNGITYVSIQYKALVCSLGTNHLICTKCILRETIFM